VAVMFSIRLLTFLRYLQKCTIKIDDGRGKVISLLNFPHTGAQFGQKGEQETFE